MGHPETKNGTPFHFEPLFVTNEKAQPIFVALIKGTFTIGASGKITLAETQLPANLTGESWGDPAVTSLKYEPETAFTKASTDVVLIGHARAQRSRQASVDVRLQVGDKMSKHVRVLGDRVWLRRLGIITVSEPEPFESIPLIYERAFGGWDSPEPDPMCAKFEVRNPVGMGFKRSVFEEGLPVPNLEDPKKPLRIYGETPPPACFGFVAPHWQPRAALAGTYDEKWQKNRFPLLPQDFNLRFMNAASPGLISAEYLRGNERIVIEGVAPNGVVAFELPGLPAPWVRVRLQRKDEQKVTALDTVIINMDENLLILIWRIHFAIPDGPLSIAEIAISPTEFPAETDDPE